MRTELNNNATLFLRDGSVAHVNRIIGSGGQGLVYSVTVNGEEYALKWYKQNPGNAFYQNLQKNAEDGAPSPSFLWPKAVTKVKYGSFGYIMPLKPEGYCEFSEYRLAKVRFSSFRAILNAAIELCEAFRLLHAKGLSFQDLNDGGFFIHPRHRTPDDMRLRQRVSAWREFGSARQGKIHRTRGCLGQEHAQQLFRPFQHDGDTLHALLHRPSV